MTVGFGRKSHSALKSGIPTPTTSESYWKPALFGFKSEEEDDDYPYMALSGCYAQCIPYNEKTKHLINTAYPYKAEEN